MAACLRVYPGAQQVRMYKLLARRVHHQEGLHLLKDSPADASCRRQLEHVGKQALQQQKQQQQPRNAVQRQWLKSCHTRPPKKAAHIPFSNMVTLPVPMLRRGHRTSCA